MDDKTYIEQLIQEFNRVFLISENFGIEFRQKKTESLKLRCSDILILSTKPLDVAENQGVRKQISEEKAKKIYMLYHMYEFTDNFSVFEQGSVFATIFNYVHTGILTLDEAWRVLLEE